MRRFSGSQNVGYHSWPEEYKPQFLPMLKRQEYQAGSLQSSSFKQALKACTSTDIKALPPVVECSWNDSQKHEIRNLIASFIGHDSYNLLILHNRAPALNVGGFVVGSSLSRYTTKTHVMAAHPHQPSEIHLVKVEHYCMLNYTIHGTSQTSTVSKWVACVTFYEVHPCRVWYGGLTEVWCRTQSASCNYVPLSSIVSRVAYCEAEVDFGRVIGKQTVLVVSILSNFSS